MKGLFQCSLVATMAVVALASPLNHGRHQHHHHHDKRALVVVTRTQQVVEIEYIYETVTVDPATVASSEPISTSTSSSSSSSSSSSFSSSSSIPTPTSTLIPSSFSAYVAPPPPTTSQTSTSVPEPILPTQPILFYDPNTIVATTTSTTSTTPLPEPTLSLASVEVIQAPSPIPSPQPQPSQSTGTSPNNGKWFEGKGTYYDCGLGSCGNTNDNGEYVAALSKTLMLSVEGANPNANPYCGKKIRVYSDMAPKEGVVFTVQDKCPGCINLGDVDFCRTPFLAELGTEVQGHVPIRWHWEP